MPSNPENPLELILTLASHPVGCSVDLRALESEPRASTGQAGRRRLRSALVQLSKQRPRLRERTTEKADSASTGPAPKAQRTSCGILRVHGSAPRKPDAARLWLTAARDQQQQQRHTPAPSKDAPVSHALHQRLRKAAEVPRDPYTESI